MSRSGGEITIAVTCDAMRKRNANHPKIGQRLVRGATVVPVIGAGGGLVVMWSYLDHCLEREKGRGEKDHIEHDEKPGPCPRVTHQVTAEQGFSCFHGGEKHWHQHGKEQERKQYFAGSAAARHRR